MNEWMMYLYSALLCIVVHPKRFTIIWGGGGGICTHNNNNKDNYTNSVHTNGQLIFIVYCKHAM